MGTRARPGEAGPRGPRRGASLLLALLGAAAVFLALDTMELRGDGGTLRVANVPMGAYRVSVYTEPTPISPDSIDVSVLVTFERGRGVALGLEIEVAARRLDGAGGWIRQPATREQATDARYYAAKFSLGSVGDWEVVVRVAGPEGDGEVTFPVEVREPGPFSNPYLILVVAFLPLLLVGWWLKASARPRGAAPGQGGGLSSPSTRPGD